MRRVILLSAAAAIVGTGFSIGSAPASAYCDPEQGPCLSQYGETVVCLAQKAVKETKQFVGSMGNCFIHPT